MSRKRHPKRDDGRDRWTLVARRRHCFVCDKQTAHAEHHQIDDYGVEHIETRCIICDQVTSRQRKPVPNTQLPLE